MKQIEKGHQELNKLLKRRLVLFAALILIFTAGSSAWCPESIKNIDEIVKKHALIIQEYEILVKGLLVPAGVASEFETFIIKNPDFYRDSFKRSQTAHVIRKILQSKPKWLAVFENCGLSQPGEYICWSKTCFLHMHIFEGKREMSPEHHHDLLSYIFYLCAVIGGLLLFVGVMGAGRYICSWLDKKFPEKTSD